MQEKKILWEGHNCWRLTHSSRAAFLVDGEAYFAAVASAVERARRSVFILGWDIDSRIRMYRDGRPRAMPNRLGSLLNAAAARSKELHIRILDWDFAMLYALEREPLPILRLGWQSHKRVHFRLDDQHPIGASHHQKIIVVDDRIAFVGGLDLAQGRWDTPAHAADEPRRRDNGHQYPPFHDVQMLVDGETAVALGQLARRRWRRVTGKKAPPTKESADPWPPDIAPDVMDVQVGIARTEPAFNAGGEVREVEALYRDAIAAAKSSIYIENQYLTSAALGKALAARLEEKNGPEILLVLPRECSGWLEETTMGVMRARVLRQLRQADRYGRLRVFYPSAEGLGSHFIQVHSKLLVVDDRLLRIGSANLNNRSMGLDTECDLAIEAERPEVQQALAGFRHRLLAEHLGSDPTTVAAAVERQGSLLRAVETLNKGPRTLRPLNGAEENWLEQMVPEWPLVDPMQSTDMEQFINEFVAKDLDRSAWRRMDRRWIVLAAILLGALALTAAWRWTPLHDWPSLAKLQGWGAMIEGSVWAPWAVVACFVIGGMLMFPVTLLILATTLVFSPVPGFFLALGGCVASAVVSYGLGSLLGRETVHGLAGTRLHRLSQQLGRRGLVAVLVVRFLPIAPFIVVNLVAGASHINFRDFALGTVLGMAPGILAITIFEQSLVRVVRQPEIANIAILAGVLLGIFCIIWFLRRWIARKAQGETEGEDDG
ncbi:MAG: VTT domain-containing protein [Desulfuromonadales bacterium]